MILAVYVLMFLTIGVGVMIAVKAQVEHENDSVEAGDIPENIGVKRHRATGWRYW